MRYIDPYEFFEIRIESLDSLTPAILKRARQRKLAEFDLSDDGFIYWENEAVEKRLALDLAEALEDPQKAAFYFRIREDRNLKRFFSNGSVKDLQSVFSYAILQDEAFRDFCSPFFASAFDRVLRLSMESQDWGDATFLLEKSALLDVMDMDAAYGAALRYLQQTILELESACRDPRPISHLAKIDYIRRAAFVSLVNRYPDHFQAHVNKLSRRIRDFAIAIDKSATSKSEHQAEIRAAWQLICVACDIKAEINVSEDNEIYKRRIKARYDDFTAPSQTSSSNNAGPKKGSGAENKSKAKNRGCLIALLVAFILYVVASFLFDGFRGSSKEGTKEKRFAYNNEIPKYKSREMAKRDYVVGSMKSGMNEIGARKVYANLKNTYPDLPSDIQVSKTRPATGWIPYKTFCKQLKPRGAVKNKGFNFKNKSNTDMVLFIDKGFGSELQLAFYVRAKDETSFKKLEDGVYFFHSYPGWMWSDSIAECDEIALPGFKKPDRYVASFSLDAKNPAPSSVVSFFSYQNRSSIIEYDGHKFYVK